MPALLHHKGTVVTSDPVVDPGPTQSVAEVFQAVTDVTVKTGDGGSDITSQRPGSRASRTRHVRLPLLGSRGRHQLEETLDITRASSSASVEVEGVGKVEHSLGETVTACAISSDGAFFAATCMNKKVVCYSSVDGIEMASFVADAATTAVQCISRGDELLLVVGTFSGDLRFYSATMNKELMCTKYAPGGAVNCITVAAGIGGDDATVRICVGGQTASIVVYQLSLHPPPVHLSLADTDAADVTEPGLKLQELVRLKAMGPVLALSMSNNGMLLAAGGESKIVELWSLREPAPDHGGTLVVNLVSATGLLAGDSNGLSDPYVILDVGKHHSRSKTIKRTLNPHYNQTFHFAFSNTSPPGPHETVGVRVFDWDRASYDDSIGSGFVHTGNLWNRLMDGKIVRADVPLNDQQTVPGCVQLDLSWIPNTAPNTSTRAHRSIAGLTPPQVGISSRQQRASKEGGFISSRQQRASKEGGFSRKRRASTEGVSEATEDVAEETKREDSLEAAVEVKFRCTTTVHAVSFNAVADILAVGSNIDTELYTVCMPKPGSTKTTCEVEPLTVLAFSAQQGGISWAASSNVVVVGGQQLVTVYDVQTGATLAKTKKTARVRCVALSRCGNKLVVGGFDKKVSFSTLSSGTQLKHISGTGGTVRSVHISSDGKLSAVGCENKGAGACLLYSLPSCKLLHTWEHAKVVWVTRISPDSQLVAACGYDMAMTLYSTRDFSKITSIKYPIFGGPSFIWSCCFSADSGRLAVANWNARTYLYQVKKNKVFRRSHEGGDEVVELTDGEPSVRPNNPYELIEIGEAVRADRCYAVDLDVRGEHMATGGRDKKIAVYKYSDGFGTLELKWEKTSEDFVYAVALSNDMEYCAIGGTDKKVVVYAGMSGMQLFSIPVIGTIWALMIHSPPGGKERHVAAGGEFGSVKIFDLLNKKEVMHIPSADTCFDVSLSDHSVAYTVGTTSGVYGFEGDFVWSDMPSYEVTTSWVMAMIGDEEELLHALSLLLERSPALVNTKHPETGLSLLHFAVQHTNQPKLMQMLLDSSCSVGLGTSLGKYSICSTLELSITLGKLPLLQRMLEAARTPSFAKAPATYELLNLSLRSMSMKYPSSFLEVILNTELQPEPEVLGEQVAQDVMLTREVVRGTNSRSPVALWADTLAKSRVAAVLADADPASTAAAAAADKKEDATMFGFTKMARPGPQALRVPYAAFAGCVPEQLGNPAERSRYKTPLELIVAAAARTQDHSVFGSPVVEVLVDWKWQKFVKRDFINELVFYLLHLTIVLLWNVEASETAIKPLSAILGQNEGSEPHYYLLVLWVWTTVACFTFARNEIQKLCSLGPGSYFRDVYSCFDAFYVVAQGIVNTLFWLRDLAPVVMFQIIDPVQAYNYTEYVFGGLDQVVYGQLVYDQLAARHSDTHGRALRTSIFDENPDLPPFLRRFGHHQHVHDTITFDADLNVDHGRVLKGGDESTGLSSYALTGRSAGPFMSLQSFVVLTSFLRLLYFFRASIQFGALVPCVTQILVDIAPMIVLLSIITLGFSFSMLVLMQCELGAEDFPDYSDALGSLFASINMGLYTYFDASVINMERNSLVLILYEIFMFTTQIVLLNMIIAIMGEAQEKVRKVAVNVAKFERAKVILAWEKKWLKKQGGVFGPARKRWANRRAKMFGTEVSSPFPKWLHVLRPAEHSDADGEGVHISPVSEEQLALKLESLKADFGAQMDAALSAAARQNTEALVELGTKVKSMGSFDAQSNKGTRPPTPKLEPGAAFGNIVKAGVQVEAIRAARRASREKMGIPAAPLPSTPAPQPASTAKAPLAELLSVKVPSSPPPPVKEGEPKVSHKVREQAVMRPVLSIPDAPAYEDPRPGASPSFLIDGFLLGEKFDAAKAKEIASRMREPSYSLKNFYDDCVLTFPELKLYLMEEKVKQKRQAPRRYGDKLSGSGRSKDTEYLRTIGALFAIYWLMRIGIDGEDGFVRGVDAAWQPVSAPSSPATVREGAPFYSMSSAQKMAEFSRTTDWKALQTLLKEAGLLVPSARDANKLEVGIERTVAMLSLTAIHDIMKIEALLPTVQPEHAEFRGFHPGDKINDHDSALAYVLEFYGECLPSYSAMGCDQIAAVKLTQAQLSFNHGWFVQAEAPPGELFGKLKKIVSTAGVQSEDIAFYFVHWLTDLAGADPTPLKGSEKFVLRFPHQVLHAFIASFSFVGMLAERSETAVYEKYLEWRWKSLANDLPEIGKPPSGKEAVALMRVVVAAQEETFQRGFFHAFNDELAPRDKQVLAIEMGMSGCKDVGFRSQVDDPLADPTMGPAFLIYYGPQFMRSAGRNKEFAGALQMLAEIYRQARSLWPLSKEHAGTCVTVRIEQMKDHTPTQIQDGHRWGDGWFLLRRNQRESAVEQRPIYMINSTLENDETDVRLLCLWNRHPEDEAEDAEFLEELELIRQTQNDEKELGMAVESIP